MTVLPAVAAAGTEPAICRREHVERRGRRRAASPRFADADDRRQPGPQRRLGLGAHQAVGLAVIGAPLGMADDDIAGAGVLQHLGRDVAGMGPALPGDGNLRRRP